MKFSLLCTLVSLMLYEAQGVPTSQAVPDVKLSVGTAKGSQKTSDETKKPYNVYYGIPFAEPPVGELRFMPPKPYVGSGPDAVLTSDNFRATCWNVPNQGGIGMSEDCLHLNIFTPPDASPDNIKKVLVYIHGGAFITGSASFFVPSGMVTNDDVIVVTLQYRLAAFGFLSSADASMPGNMGLKDMLLGLKWVKANIHQFGGDADDITLSAESAGAMSASALSITPEANGLFTKVILQSGNVMSSLAVQQDPTRTFNNFATASGCVSPENNNDKVVECLQKLTTEEIINAHPSFVFQVEKTFAEQQEFNIIGTDTDLFPKLPRKLLEDKVYLEKNGVLSRKYLMGVVDNEGLLVPVMAMMSGRAPTDFVQPETVNALVLSVMTRYLRTDPPQSVIDAVTFLYTYPRDKDGNIPFERVVQIQDDDLFTVPLFLFAHALLVADPSTQIYLYLFDAEPKLANPDGGFKGTIHTMDLIHEFDRHPALEALFFYASMDPVKFPIIRDHFRDYITDFAKTGSPVSDSSWPLYNETDEKYMHISSNPEVKQRMHEQRIAMWMEFVLNAVAQERAASST